MTIPLPGSAATLGGELERLAALYASGMLGDGPQPSLDALVALAASLLDCPVAMLNLVDHDVQHVRASVGTSLTSTPRDIALCDHAIREPEGLVIPDLAADPRFAANPLIEQGIRFYAGVPVSAPDQTGTSRPIGALCVTDAVPRRLDERGRAVLRQLAGLADMLIAARADAARAVAIAAEHRRLVIDLARYHRIFHQAERMAGLGSWRLSLIDERIEWSDGVYRIYGLDPGVEPDLTTALSAYPEAARARVAAALAAAVEGGSFDFEEDFIGAGGELRRVRCFGERERADGEDVAVVGVIHDVTDRHRAEIALRRDADTDALTGLANRAAFDRALGVAIKRARATSAPLLLALIDLDGFKLVNDTLGHAAGDDVLRQVGAALSALPVAATTIARVGGDEFALLVEGDGDEGGLADTVERALALSVRGQGLTLACSGSVGTALLAPGEHARDFVHRADVALYAMKRARVGERRRSERRAA